MAYTGTDLNHATRGEMLNQISGNRHLFNSDTDLFEKPTDFVPALPCNFYRRGNKITHDMDFTQYKGGTKIYVDRVLGNDSTGDGTSSLPYKSGQKALTVALAGEDSAYDIVLKKNQVFMRDEFFTGAVTINKNISIYPERGRAVISNGQNSLSWTSDGGGVYHTTRSSVTAVYDLLYKDSDGFYKPYTAKSSLTECQNEVGSWYVTGSTVYLHTIDGTEPTSSRHLVLLNSYNFKVTVSADVNFYIENIDFLTGDTNHSNLITSDSATPHACFIANKCFFGGGCQTYPFSADYGNSINIRNFKYIYMFECKGGYANLDVFNYSFEGITSGLGQQCLVLEYNCYGKEAGYFNGQTNTNISTVHTGGSIIRFGTKGRYAAKAIADVQECYSICIDCDMGESFINDYYFGYEGETGKAILVNCISRNQLEQTFEIETELYNFSGTRDSDATHITVDE